MATLKLKVDPSGMVLGSRRGKDALRSVGVQARITESAVDRMSARGSAAINTLSRSFSLLRAGARTASFAIVGLAAAAFAKAATSAKSLDAALAETSTLIDGTTTQMEFLRRTAQDMAQQFGGSSTDQVTAFYQAISAGSATVESAAVLLQSANKLAVGGVTDTKTAVDVLTSAVNAYAASGLTAKQASDILFTGVKAGKTTVSELASTLGNVIPIAASVGIGFDQVVGSVAALTTQGQSTALAVTGVRAALSGILKPSGEAVKIAKALGIEFSASALKAKGFGGFMDDIVAKTGGSQAAMAKLFGSVEALNAVLSFAGGAGEKYVSTMDAMANSAGAADAAFRKMKDGLSKRFDTALSKIAVAAEKVGTVLMRVAVPAIEAISNNLPIATAAVTAFGIALAIAFAPIMGTMIAVAGGIALLTGVIGTPSDGQGLTSGLYDAKDGTDALNAALGIFEKTNAPNAGRAAAALANEHYALAQSSVVAAKAQVALMRTELSAQKSAAGVQGNAFGKDLVDQSQADLELALKSLDTQLAALQTAVSERDKAITKLRYGGTGGGAGSAGTVIPISPKEKELQDKVAALLAKMSKTSGGSVTAAASAFDQLVASLDPAIAATMKYAKAQSIVAKALKSGKIDQAEANRLLALAKAAYSTASKSALSFKDVLVKVSGAIATDIGNGFLDMVSGTKTVAESFRSMAADIVRELYKVLVVQRIVASFKSILGGGGGGINIGHNLFSGSSFAGGGFTGNGPRAGGLDGQGGFLAMMHPKETVIDHTRGQSGGANITINQTFTGGVTRADLGNAVPRIVDASKAAVLDAMRRHQGGFV